MRFQKSLTLRDGGQLTLRSLEKRDAAAAIWVMRKVAGETDFLLREVDECGMTIAQEEGYIAQMNESPRDAFICAFVDGQLVGMASVSQIAPRFRVRHRASVGVSLTRAHWSRGIGTAMMRVLIDLAKDAGYEQLELEAVENNERAVALYEKLGFETVGRMPRAMKYSDGSYADFLSMWLDLTKASE